MKQYLVALALLTAWMAMPATAQISITASHPRCTIAAGLDQVHTEGGTCGLDSTGLPKQGDLLIIMDSPGTGSCGGGVGTDAILCIYDSTLADLKPASPDGTGGGLPGDPVACGTDPANGQPLFVVDQNQSGVLTCSPSPVFRSAGCSASTAPSGSVCMEDGGGVWVCSNGGSSCAGANWDAVSGGGGFTPNADPGVDHANFDAEVTASVDVAANTAARHSVFAPNADPGVNHSSFDSEVESNTEVAANTAARHTVFGPNTDPGVDHTGFSAAVAAAAAVAANTAASHAEAHNVTSHSDYAANEYREQRESANCQISTLGAAEETCIDSTLDQMFVCKTADAPCGSGDWTGPLGDGVGGGGGGYVDVAGNTGSAVRTATEGLAVLGAGAISTVAAEDTPDDTITISVADAASGAKGVVQLTGDLGGTATAPTVTDDQHAHTNATVTLDHSDTSPVVKEHRDRRESADCSNATGGSAEELCVDSVLGQNFVCLTADAPCGAAQWTALGDGGSSFTPDVDPGVDHANFDAEVEANTEVAANTAARHSVFSPNVDPGVNHTNFDAEVAAAASVAANTAASHAEAHTVTSHSDYDATEFRAQREEANCATATGGVAEEICIDTTLDQMFVCKTVDAVCGSGDWTGPLGDGTGSPVWTENATPTPNALHPTTIANDVAIGNADPALAKILLDADVGVIIRCDPATETCDSISYSEGNEPGDEPADPAVTRQVGHGFYDGSEAQPEYRWRGNGGTARTAVAMDTTLVGDVTGTPAATVVGNDSHDHAEGSSLVTIAAADVISGAFVDARIAESNVTQHEAAIDHDVLTNFVAGEHYPQRAVADCSAASGGVQEEICRETADNSIWICTTSTCSGAGWVEHGDGSGGGGTMSTFDLAADSGTPETVGDGETVSIIGAGVISTAVAATNQITIAHGDLVGDVTGAPGATVVGDDSHNHGDSTINGLDASAVTTGAFNQARIDTTDALYTFSGTFGGIVLGDNTSVGTTGTGIVSATHLVSTTLTGNASTGAVMMGTGTNAATWDETPTFVDTVTFPTPFTLGAISVTSTGTELNLLDGITVLSGSNTGDEPAATTGVVGVARLATVGETQTGTATTTAVMPDGLEASTIGEDGSIGGGGTLTECVSLLGSGATQKAAGTAALTTYDGTNFSYPAWALDAASDEQVDWSYSLPPNIAGTTATVEVAWMTLACTASSADDVCFVWNGGGFQDDDAFDGGAFSGTETFVQDKCTTVGDIHWTAATSWTHGYDVASPKDDTAVFQVIREQVADATCTGDNDAISGDIKLVAVRICYEVTNLASGEDG